MSQITDAKHSALIAQGFTSQINEMLLAWLQDTGATSGNLADAWLEVIILNGHPPQRNTGWYELLGALGFSGSLSDRELAFWVSGGVIGP